MNSHGPSNLMSCLVWGGDEEEGFFFDMVHLDCEFTATVQFSMNLSEIVTTTNPYLEIGEDYHYHSHARRLTVHL